MPLLEKAVAVGSRNSNDFSSYCPSPSLKPFSGLRIVKKQNY
jgi:hypothetical protein